ncbi:MAG: hypothetical protein JW726_08055 [Anaerolineales bacterium]|nr:hypothetical protein [Anaerolineales bacterium]
MNPERPDLDRLLPEVRAYIEALESELANLRQWQASLQAQSDAERAAFQEPSQPSEEPTPVNVFTLSAFASLKRTPRHLYQRQRRGGMGIFDLETSDDDPPVALTLAEESHTLLLFSSLGRAFRLPVSLIAAAEVRARGQSLADRLGLEPEERLVSILPFQAKGAVALVSQSGYLRLLRYHLFGEHMKPGTVMLNSDKFGPLAAACLTPADGDLFIATRQGRAIRFAERLVPPQGGPGMRLEPGDAVVAISAVGEEDAAFLVGANGQGALRLMSGFAANKSMGGGGKIAMHSDCLVAAARAAEGDDIFLISRLSKIIRFAAADVPAKESPVQGVNCMSLRGDEVAALAVACL